MSLTPFLTVFVYLDDYAIRYVKKVSHKTGDVRLTEV
jgi:hypothetical protein